MNAEEKSKLWEERSLLIKLQRLNKAHEHSIYITDRITEIESQLRLSSKSEQSTEIEEDPL